MASTRLPPELSVSPARMVEAQTALARNPSDDGALHTLGLAKYGEGEPQAAIDLIVQANQISPSNPTYCLSLGRILAREKMYNQATLAYLAAQELDPANPVLLTELAESLLALGKREEAKQVLETANTLYRQLTTKSAALPAPSPAKEKAREERDPTPPALPGVPVLTSPLALSGFEFPRVHRFGDAVGTSFIGVDLEGKAFLKLEVIPNPNKKLHLAEEARIIEDLNRAGCVTCPRLLAQATVRREDLARSLNAEGLEALAAVETQTFAYFVQAFIPNTGSPSLGDLLLVVLEQKALGVFHSDLRIENCRMDQASGVCYLVDYDQAERLDDETRKLGARAFFDFCNTLIEKKFGRWGFKHFLQYFPKIDPEQALAEIFDGDALNLASTRLFTNQITTAAKAGVYHTIEEKEFFIRGERSLDSRRERLDQLTFQPGERVLDVGCSSGIISTYLARRGCVVTGVDLDGEIIQGCRILANILGTGNTYHHHDLDTGPVPGEFDTVLLFSVIHHTKKLKENAQAIAAQCRRIIIECRLSEGGMKPVADGRWQHTSNWQFGNPTEMVAFLEQLFPGFTLARNLGKGDRDRFMLEFTKN